MTDPQVDPIPEVQDDVTLTWEDYLLTNTNAAQGSSAVATKATTEANRYRVQVSTVPNFQTLLDNVLVDQRQFTSFGNTYPEGNVYWRVQATDGSGNALTWSPTRVFLKKSPVPTLLEPTTTDPETVPGYTAFTWNPLDYAASYDLEVYKDGDTQANTANRVVNAGSAQTALSISNPLPVSANPYVWRVRRVDAQGRPGGWSLWGRSRSARSRPARPPHRWRLRRATGVAVQLAAGRRRLGLPVRAPPRRHLQLRRDRADGRDLVTPRARSTRATGSGGSPRSTPTTSSWRARPGAPSRPRSSRWRQNRPASKGPAPSTPSSPASTRSGTSRASPTPTSGCVAQARSPAQTR